MDADTETSSDLNEYIALPGARHSGVEVALEEQAYVAQGRLALGCFMVWISDTDYLVTVLPPMGDIRGSSRLMIIYTAEHIITIQGRDLHILAWAMKHQALDTLRVTSVSPEEETATDWTVTAISIEQRDES